MNQTWWARAATCALASCLAALLPGTALAQDGGAEVAGAKVLPDPAEVTLPPLSFPTDEKALKESYKFFVFHHPGLTYEEASQDFAECRAHLARGDARLLPGFVAWVDEDRRGLTRAPSAYGLVGDLVLALVAPKMERGIANSKMRMCMTPRGYDRYAVDQAGYDALQEGEERMVIAMQAKLATGPVPAAEKLP